MKSMTIAALAATMTILNLRVGAASIGNPLSNRHDPR